MNTKSFSKLAGISAIAMIAAMYATDVSAQYVIGTNQAVNFNAIVDNTIDVTVTDGTFGTISAMNSNVAGDTATATLPALAGPQILVDDHSTGFGTATQAHIVGNDALPGTAAIVDVSNAFAGEQMYVTFTTCVNLTTGAGPRFVLDDVTTNLPGATPYDCATPMATGHVLTVDGTGVGQFFVGASITTDGTTDVAYPDGTYTGSVQMQITY